VFALAFPRGLWGWVEDHAALRLLPIGYRLRLEGEPRAEVNRPTGR
jgi:branched-chain amino acid transport system permease protein